MKWKNRQIEIQRLRSKHGRDRSLAYSLPDLSVRRTYPSLSDGFAAVRGKREAYKKPEHLIVDILHKQGPMVISRDEVQYAGGKKV